MSYDTIAERLGSRGAGAPDGFLGKRSNLAWQYRFRGDSQPLGSVLSGRSTADHGRGGPEQMKNRFLGDVVAAP